jgi:hypothetical protein
MVTYVYCSLIRYVYVLGFFILVKQRISEVYSTADGLLLPDDIIRPLVHASTQRVLLDISGICY